MKIEMGESLFYSWLRHVKGCQIVQTNWKVSLNMWPLAYEEELEHLLKRIDDFYIEKHKYKVFGNNASLSQLLRQGECDVLGISLQPDENRFYAVDVAYHQNGLNYGSSDETVMKIIEKCSRTAFCLYGFMAVKS